jgi:branched-subunit amino acid transport protein
MPGYSPPARRFLTYSPRAILSALMWLAVIVLERRIRKALRSAEVPNGSA